MLAIIQFVGKHWKAIGITIALLLSFSMGWNIRAGMCDAEQKRIQNEFFIKSNEESKNFEDARELINKNKRKVVNVKTANPDCVVTSRGVSKLNAALSNNASELDKPMPIY